MSNKNTYQILLVTATASGYEIASGLLQLLRNL